MSKLYSEAAFVLKKYRNKSGGIKNLVYNGRFKSNKKAIYALVCQTEIYFDIIQAIIPSTLKKQIKQIYLLEIMLYDLLFNKKNKGIRGGGQVKRIILSYKTQLDLNLKKYLQQHNITSINDIIKPENIINLPRYVRINTLKANVTLKFIKDYFIKKEAYTFYEHKPANLSILLEKKNYFFIQMI